MARRRVLRISDFVFRKVSLVAAYASILPVGRRRELYARFLRGVEGDANRCEALAKARQHIPDDVPAILKKVRYREVSTGGCLPFVWAVGWPRVLCSNGTWLRRALH